MRTERLDGKEKVRRKKCAAKAMLTRGEAGTSEEISKEARGKCHSWVWFQREWVGVGMGMGVGVEEDRKGGAQALGVAPTERLKARIQMAGFHFAYARPRGQSARS